MAKAQAVLTTGAHLQAGAQVTASVMDVIFQDISYRCRKHIFVRQGQVCRQDAGSQRADGVQSRSGCSTTVEAGGCEESG